MTDPTVCCVMLTRDRPAMAARAVRSFRAQTYQHKWMAILDTGDYEWFAPFAGTNDVLHYSVQHHNGRSIGALRNLANVASEADIIAHWDSDDVSHPNRLAEQVALLQASGVDCVGYNEMLFWDTRRQFARVPLIDVTYGGFFGGEPDTYRRYEAGLPVLEGGEAWLYRNPSRNYALGTSLCYWRKTWERKPFADINHGEDVRWITGLKVVGVSANHEVRTVAPVSGLMRWEAGDECEPLMICSIHGQNTSVYAPEKDRNMWKRVADWDAYCQETMKL